MFTSFSGNSRRPRQVNLGGRKTHAFGSTGSGAGSQAAVDKAQQERIERQQDRQRLQAARRIQRVWRGCRSRRQLATVLQGEFDELERRSPATQSYESEEQSWEQLRRILRFTSTRTQDDVERIRRYIARQRCTVDKLDVPLGGPWPMAYLKLEISALGALERYSVGDGHLPQIEDLLAVLQFLSEQIPAETAANGGRYYATLAKILTILAGTTDMDKRGGLVESLLKATLSPLTSMTRHTLDAYEGFGIAYLQVPVLTGDGVPSWASHFRTALPDSINYKLLARALATVLRDDGLQRRKEFEHLGSRLRLLGAFIYFHRFAHGFQASGYASYHDFVTVVALLLNSLPVDLGAASSSKAGSQGLDGEGCTRFIKEQVSSLVHQEGIGNLLSGAVGAQDTSDAERVEEAKQLANYALALLRFFPDRGDDIRMWLYIGPSEPAGRLSHKAPAIRYFWEASRHSSVFEGIMQDSRAAVRLLRSGSANGDDDRSMQGARWQRSRQESRSDALHADEWRVILVFLELYTFVLKLTDDEEFFAKGKEFGSSSMRENSLPLSDVRDLTTFLKNLGFTLYFNAADINGDRMQASDGSLSYFNPGSERPQQERVAEPSIGGVAGLSLDYVKGLVTGLLRMVYERDSRRNFLPHDHWLMTSRFDMNGFIPSVVEEEESRHRIQAEDAEDVDEEEQEEDEPSPRLIGTSRTQQQRRLEQLQRQQRKASRRRYLQAVAPRLEILQNMPFFIPFTTRVQIFREFVHLDMVKRRGGADPEAWRWMQRADGMMNGARHTAKIRRDHEFDDAFSQFYDLGAGLKEPIQITFVDQFDQPEAGIDGGGVTKEFLTSVTSRAFLPSDDIEMFVENDQHLLYPNPGSVEEVRERLRQAGLRDGRSEYRAQVSEFLQRYEFLGRIIGKCLYEGILVDVNFAPFFLRKWALTGGPGSAPNESSYRPTLNDLRDLDEALYQGLHQLKTYNGDVEDFALNFTVTDTVIVDHVSKKTKTITRDLKPDGANTPVTNQNRLVYISYVARHRLQNQPFLQTSAFLRGLSSMIQPSWLSMFNQSELQTLIGGTSSSIDVDDLRRNTIYGGTYVIGDDGLEHPTVQLFWKTMRDLNDKDRRAVLKFVTSTPRAPLLGFGTLNPRFSIRDAGNDQERLPSTSTCVNLLKLPMYSSERVLREKLLYSVFSGAGFDLS